MIDVDVANTTHSNEVFNVKYMKCGFDDLFRTFGLPDTL